MRHLFASSLVLAAACAGAPVRSDADLQDLRSQLQAQQSLIAQQQRRIEELEVKLAAIAGSRSPVVAPQPQAPAKSEPRPKLKTVRLGEGRRPRPNPVARAPLLPASVELREPDLDTLDRLAAPVESSVDSSVAASAGADHAWALAVREVNEGATEKAESDLLAFVAAHPRHAQADNALYLAGMTREIRGDCAAAVQIFAAVPARYPAGDAVPGALLEQGRCLAILGRRDDAKRILDRLLREHEGAQEAEEARRLLGKP